MSRLIVKNLPAYVAPERLRQHFEQKGAPGGTLTDIKVAHKQDGTSRRFGFVGYKTENEALAAKQWFDRTFIDSTRISVSVIEVAKDAPAPRPNKRPRLGSSPKDESVSEPMPKHSNSKQATEGGIPNKLDSQLDEYMKVMQPRTKKGPTWANESQPTTKVPTAPEQDAAEDEPMDSGGTAGPQEEGISDLEWMRRHMKKDVDVVEKAFEQSDDENDAEKTSPASRPEKSSPSPEVPKDPTRETILQTARLFVRNLAFSCTDADLLELFRPYGEISQVHIPVDGATKEPKGVAYVTFAEAANAFAAHEALDRKSFQGRLIHILAAVDRKGNVQVEDAQGRKKTIKEDKQAKRKATAGKEFNWSMLYMNSDAVASSIADRLSIDKSAILNPESGDNAAVKLALAETHIIQETKSYLESHGVLLSSFTSRARSDTTILVKNIPYGTSAEQIREMFEPHGELQRVLVPPAGTMAVVDFGRPDEAAKAFRAVAYRRLGNSVVYLEKGPLGMFTEGPVPGPSSPLSSFLPELRGVRIAEREMGGVAEGVEGDAEGEPSIAGGTTLYVKNLSFATTQERLTKVFEHLPSFSFARVQTRPDPKQPEGSGARMSMGYGFIGFKDVEGAKKALRSMQGFVLDGHALHVKFAGRGQQEEKVGEVKKGGGRTTKMIVKNVPFEATKKDIRALFGAHGHLKSVRLPKKFDSRTRGFAFLDFVSRAEAENVFATLRHTHLLGRHLVLEWAEEAEQDLEVLRKKAGVGYGDGDAMPGRKRKLDLGKRGEDDPDELVGS